MKKILTQNIILIAFLGLSFTSLKAQYVTIPDTYFRNFLIQEYPSCFNANQQMDTTCAEIVNDTVLSTPGGYATYILNIEGLQYFDSLKYIICASYSGSYVPKIPSRLIKFEFTNSNITNLPELPSTLERLNLFNADLTVLPSLPEGLTYLNCKGNNLINLPTLPNTLKFLDCSFNNMTSLPTLPSSLEELYCMSAGSGITSSTILPEGLLLFNCTLSALTSLPNLPSTLVKLVCTNNQLTTLPALPNSLQELTCYQNLLTSLPTLPDSLLHINCRLNQLTTLPTLPQYLYYLECSFNQLTALPSLPGTLGVLDCNNNQLNSLPILDQNLYDFNFANNQIASLGTLPGILKYLNCQNNQLADLPELPNGVLHLKIDSNSINCLPILPQNITQFSFLGNPISCLPNYISVMDSTTLTLPLCASGNMNGCPVARGVLGTIYRDNNATCMLDGNDYILQNIQVKFLNLITNQFGSTYTLSNGIYSYPTDTGTYMVLVDTLNKPYQANCSFPGIDSTVVTSSLNPLASNVNFDIACKPGLDLNVQSVNHKNGLVFPGQQHTLQVMVGDASQWYGLNCASGTGGNVQITVTGPVAYNGVAQGALMPLVNGNVYTYNIVDFGEINNSTDFQLLFLVDTTAQIGTQVCVNVEVTSSTNDINQSNNIKDYCYHVVNSYDPNYKEVYPTDVAPLFQDWLTYTIHFQNLGNAPAINIRVLDTLDSNLEAETFEVINFSHYNTVTLMNGILDFRFPNILLPDSASNPSGSQGFVQYRIKPKANLMAGTQIENTAHIYFDYNPAVVTNTTINNFTTTVGNKSLPQASRLWLYPNPSTGIFAISAKANIEVYNVVGELIISENNATSIDLTAAPKGLYFVRLNEDKIEKLIKN